MAFEAQLQHWPSALLCLVSAILIQVGTNFFNDVADFRKGADTKARTGPLRATAAGLVSERAMFRATAVVFGLAVLAGSYLMWRGGWPIVVIGVLSILFGMLYTAGRNSLASLGVADLFVLIFFGPVAVGGTYYVQALTIDMTVVVAGLAPGVLSVAILLVNNIRDVDEDRQSGKRTLVVRLGRSWGVRMYRICVLVAASVPIALLVLEPEKRWAVLSLLALPIAIIVASRVAVVTNGNVLNAMLARTAQVLILYCVLFGIGWNL